MNAKELLKERGVKPTRFYIKRLRDRFHTPTEKESQLEKADLSKRKRCSREDVQGGGRERASG